MTPTNTDAAREAGLVALKQFPVLDGRVVRLHSDAVIDAFLSKALEGADERVARIAKTQAFCDEKYPDQVCQCGGPDCGECNTRFFLTLVTALSAKLDRADADAHNFCVQCEELESQLTTQKAAHAKMLRDEADNWPEGSVESQVAEDFRRLADKIEGRE